MSKVEKNVSMIIAEFFTFSEYYIYIARFDSADSEKAAVVISLRTENLAAAQLCTAGAENYRDQESKNKPG